MIQQSSARDIPESPSVWWRSPLALVAPVLGLMIWIEHAMGRVWWCSCGSWSAWSSDTVSLHNSQHLLDPYSLSHGLHGMMFLALLQPLADRISWSWRLFLVGLAEVIWEVVENTPYTIERYRTATVSLGYFGDSIFNSVGDVLCCLLGAIVARKLGWIRGILLFVGVELFLLWWIRDCLILNMIMLIHPIEAIKHWQLGG